jgi:hypothetical protein
MEARTAADMKIDMQRYKEFLEASNPRFPGPNYICVYSLVVILVFMGIWGTLETVWALIQGNLLTRSHIYWLPELCMSVIMLAVAGWWLWITIDAFRSR